MSGFIAQYFNTEKPEAKDLKQFLKQRIEENQTLEYKPRGMLVAQDGSMLKARGNDVVGTIALAKAVAGFANAAGGLLILGVREKETHIKGTTVKIFPGRPSPLPAHITREHLENELRSKIQFPIEGVKVVVVRLTRTHAVFLIDVPQSLRAPHRVAERYYFQRYNFSTLEMKHFQIADLFGRRRAPNLTIDFKNCGPSLKGEIEVDTKINNLAGTVARYAAVNMEILSDHTVQVIHGRGTFIEDNNNLLFEVGADSVIYPAFPFNAGRLLFQPRAGIPQMLELKIQLFAEHAPTKRFNLSMNPGEEPILTTQELALLKPTET